MKSDADAVCNSLSLDGNLSLDSIAAEYTRRFRRTKDTPPMEETDCVFIGLF